MAGVISVDILEDSSSPLPSPASSPSRNNNNGKANKFSVLEELDIKQTQNIPALEATTPGSLARRLEQFHIGDSTEKEFCESIRKPPRQKRPAIETDTFLPPPPPYTPQKTDSHRDRCQLSTSGTCGTSTTPSGEPKSKSLAVTEGEGEAGSPSLNSKFVQEQWKKHDAGQFEYVLSVPASSAAAEKYRREIGKSSSQENSAVPDPNGKVYFGCNLIQSGTSSVGTSSNENAPTTATTYTLLATPIEDCGRKLVAHKTGVKGQAKTTTATTPTTSTKTSTTAMDPQFEYMTPPREASQYMPVTYVAYDGSSPAIAPTPRIEDSFEALDQLEEQLEALDRVVRVEPVPSPEKTAKPVANKQDTLKRTSSTTKRPAKANTVRASATELTRGNSLRRSSSTVTKRDGQKPSAGPPTKREVATPASLRQPKPLAKSTKPATHPTFELPGEAVARKLKEQRDARLARAVSGEKPAAPSQAQAQVTTLQRARSARLPTRPTFELPGEAISRRKREEHQAKLRAAEEEERKRREFKARPVRASLAAPTSLPRETIASRARQNSKTAGVENGDFVTMATAATTSSVAKKRLTIGGASPGRRPLSIASNASSSLQPLTTRGRDPTSVAVADTTTTTTTTTAKKETSRAASTSTSGGGGGGSSVTAEDVEQQKRRGRDIFKRDNSLTEERERGQRERENMAKLARQEAAERSREWARRQRAKRESMMPSGGGGSPIQAANAMVTAAR